MLKTRIIPTLLWKEFGLVKGAQFDAWRRVGPVLPAIKVYNQREVDELILLDINAHKPDQEFDYEALKELSRECFIPLTVGGGVQNVNQVKMLLDAGADKVSINSCAYKNPNLITQISEEFGSQSITVSIDVKEEYGSWYCYSHAGSQPTGFEVAEWSHAMCERGAGELLITSIDRDGTYTGYDIDLIKNVVNSVNIPVIASGGAGCYDDMIAAVSEAGAAAVAAASIFHFTEKTPAGAKKSMRDAGIQIRPTYKS